MKRDAHGEKFPNKDAPRCPCGWRAPDLFLTDGVTVLAASCHGSNECAESPHRIMVQCPECGERILYRLGTISETTPELLDHCLIPRRAASC